VQTLQRVTVENVHEKLKMMLIVDNMTSFGLSQMDAEVGKTEIGNS